MGHPAFLVQSSISRTIQYFSYNPAFLVQSSISRTIKGWGRADKYGFGKESPLIDRYTRPAMGRIWSDEKKYRCWLEVESAASPVLAEDGVIPASSDTFSHRSRCG